MRYFDVENNVIDYIQGMESKNVTFCTRGLKNKRIAKLIFDKNKWKNWVDSSAKDAPPPDFYSDKYKCMLEVMCVDDHAHRGKNGKIINPTAELENNLTKQVQKINPSLFVLASTNLPTEQDHRYTWYKDNFKRVVNKHSKKISKYKANHKGFKTIFLVFDESSAYFRSNKPYDLKAIEAGIKIDGDLHCWFYDKAFLDVIRSSGADYFIWVSAYKYVPNNQVFPLFNYCCFYDLSKPFKILYEYEQSLVYPIEVNSNPNE